MAIYFYEFLYRGRPLGSAEEPAWHVVLAADGVDSFDRPFHDEQTMTMDQAVAAKWGLPDILAAINTDILAENDRLKAQIAALQNQLDPGLMAENNQLKAQLVSLQTQAQLGTSA